MSDVSLDQERGPVYTLPPEVLEEVFLRCLPHFSPLSYEVAPVSLCLVCSSWRDVVLHSPRLWRKLAINIADLDLKVSSTSQGSVFPMTRFLQYSNNQPLSIQLTASFPEQFDQSEWQTRFDYILDGVHDRVQELDLSSPWLSKFLCSLHPDIKFPKLSSITVTSSGGPSSDSLPIPFTALSHSTLLEKFIYNAHISHETVLNLDIPWSQLTHITLTDVDCASWNYIFPRCVNLQSGSFVVSRSPPPPSHFPEMTFPSLTNLAIHSTQSSRSPLNLDGYSFPNLKELTLEWSHSPGFTTGFLSSVGHLERLTILSPRFHFINMAEVLSILRLTPFISQLHVLNDHCSNELLDALIYHAHQQRPLLPHLRELEVETPHWNPIYDEEPMLDALKKMVGSRWWIFLNSKVRRLEILRITTAKQNFHRVQGALQHLTTVGLELELYPSVPLTPDLESGATAITNHYDRAL